MLANKTNTDKEKYNKITYADNYTLVEEAMCMYMN